jgi:hypothetical protein
MYANICNYSVMFSICILGEIIKTMSDKIGQVWIIKKISINFVLGTCIYKKTLN